MPQYSMFLLFTLQAVFIALNAIFSAAETAAISMNDNKMAKLAASGDKRAVRLMKLTDNPADFLATIQVGITMVNFLSSAVAASNFSGSLVAFFNQLLPTVSEALLNVIAVAIITLALTFFTVLLGELIPKRLALRNAERIALRMSGLIYFFSRIFIPVVWLFSKSANGLLRLFGIDPTSREQEDPEEEIRLMLDIGKANGTIQQEEQDMIQNIFEFAEIFADEIMTHRTEVDMLWQEETDAQWEQTIFESRHSVYPICEESPDDIIGVLNAKDYFRLTDKSRENVMANAVQPPSFVPETVRADVLFRNMQKSRKHFAIVVDEYGGMSGIITMSDLLEQLVGDLEDDITQPEELPLIEQLEEGVWRIEGTAPINDVSELLEVSLPEDYETFGGLVFGLLGHVPEDGSTPELEEYGLLIKVTEIRERRLESAEVRLVNNNP